MSGRKNDTVPSHNFEPSDIHGKSTAESSITQWLGTFRRLWRVDSSVHINIIPLEEERPWLVTLKNSNNEFLGDVEMDDWSEVQPAAAIECIGNKLHKTMAYSVEVMDEQIARSWARSLVESFAASDGSSGAVTWYTNVDLEDNSWNPVTESTFDFCLVGVDTASKSIGFLLMTDED